MEYTVISAAKLEELIAKVNEHIRDGWQGGITAQMGWTFNQAMVRDEGKE